MRCASSAGSCRRSSNPSSFHSSADMARESTQLAVLGAGPGGYAAAFYAADLGMQVTLVDLEKNPGGVCLYRGCIPSKALLHVAKVIDESRHAGAWGVTFAEPKIDVDKLRAFKQGVVDKLTSGVGQVGEDAQGEVHPGTRDADWLEVDDDRGRGRRDRAAVRAPASSRPARSPTRVPSLALDSPRMMDSTSGLEIPDVPKSLLVIGGGYIGLELGTVYATLGQQGVRRGDDRRSAARRRPRSCLGAAEASREAVRDDHAQHEGREGRGGEGQSRSGPPVRESGSPSRATSPRTSRRSIACSSPSAGGRTRRFPASRRRGVKIDAKGFIETDGQRRTAEPTIFAIGDVAGEPMLAHKASHEARVAVEADPGTSRGVRAARDSGGRVHRS